MDSLPGQVQPVWAMVLGTVLFIAVVILVNLEFGEKAQQHHPPDQMFLGSSGGLPPSASYKKEHPDFFLISLITILARWWLKRKGETK